jgi:hypothetical protein
MKQTLVSEIVTKWNHVAGLQSLIFGETMEGNPAVTLLFSGMVIDRLGKNVLPAFSLIHAEVLKAFPGYEIKYLRAYPLDTTHHLHKFV